MVSLNLIILITLSLLIKNSLCQNLPSSTTTSPTTPSPTEALTDAEGFILIYSVNYIFVLLNSISVVFILVRIYLRWRCNKRKFSMALRVPFYLALLDALLVILQFIDIIYPTIYLKILPQPYCSVVAGLNVAVFSFIRFMVAGIAISTYLRVCRSVYFDYGTYDWKIWLIAGVTSTLLACSGYKNYGPAKYWCASIISSKYVPIFSSILSISIYPTIYLKILPQPYCSVVAGLNVAVFSFIRFMVAGIAISTYLRVCRSVYFDYGTYDWKIWLIAGVTSTLLACSGYKNYGPAKYWCASIISSKYVPIFSSILSISVIGTCSFCYYNTIMKIRYVRKDTPEISNSGINCSSVEKNERIEARVTRKVAGYILVFIIQWIPSIPYEVSTILNYGEIWTFLLIVASINLGGVGNAIFYVINEGWTSKGEDSTLDTELSTPRSASNKRIQTGKEEEEEEETIPESPNTLNKNNNLLRVPDFMLNWIPEWYLELMYRCWGDDPSKRPTSVELVNFFREITNFKLCKNFKLYRSNESTILNAVSHFFLKKKDSTTLNANTYDIDSKELLMRKRKRN
ncbi:hypothetical protein Glove_86g79 [Diversispora epigaea]|uniref:G-protein coupled receptors family 1 profile domain-containing protein n=1 Tax=Diversispora epigaea TaxID=1348612 RepID=A0A397JH56_9GLOM|nr:hypothetical protein Glove_86g79 [Diversispora epigaea]